MKAKWTKILVPVLVVSIGANAYLGYKDYRESQYEPTKSDEAVLGEITAMVVDSEGYKTIEDNMTIRSIIPVMDKKDGGKFPFYYDVQVKTDRKTYLFSCDNDTCSRVESKGTMYSEYQDGEPILPLKKEMN